MHGSTQTWKSKFQHTLTIPHPSLAPTVAWSSSLKSLHCFSYIRSCTDKKLREKLLRIETLSLTESNLVVKTYERINATSAVLDEGDAIQVRQIKKLPQQFPNSQTPRAKDGEKSQKPRQCFSCGAADHLRNVCPRREANCTFCKRKGHQETVCRTKLWKQAATSSTNKAAAKCITTDEPEDQPEDAEEAQTSRVYHCVSALKSYSKDTPDSALR